MSYKVNTLNKSLLCSDKNGIPCLDEKSATNCKLCQLIEVWNKFEGLVVEIDDDYLSNFTAKLNKSYKYHFNRGVDGYGDVCDFIYPDYVDAAIALGGKWRIDRRFIGAAKAICAFNAFQDSGYKDTYFWNVALYFEKTWLREYYAYKSFQTLISTKKTMRTDKPIGYEQARAIEFRKKGRSKAFIYKETKIKNDRQVKLYSFYGIGKGVSD